MTILIRGYIDVVNHETITGWAYNPDAPGQPVVLAISIDEQPVARVVANTYRLDLIDAGIGNGRHGFSLNTAKLGVPLSPTLVGIQVEATGEHLPRSPWRLQAPLELSEPVRQTLAALLDTPGSDDDLRDRTLFLANQVDHLLQRLADRHAQRPARVALLERKWRWRPEDGPEPSPPQPRALVIDNTLPAAGRDAGSHAILSHMQSLQRLGFAVTFVPADLHGGPSAATLAAAGIEAITAPWTGSVEEVLRRQAGGWDLVYLHRIEVAGPYIPLVRRYAPRARIIYAVADLHSLRLLRQAEAEARPELFAHGNRVRRDELAAAASSHVTLTHSPAEAALLHQWLPQAVSRVVPWHFPLQPTPAPFAVRAGIAFIGSFGHPPNLDAALWLVDEIMPLVWQHDPAIGCAVAGHVMPTDVFEDRDPRIRVLGPIGDLPALLNSVRLTTAPLAYGAGLKGKVGDSLAAGVPCICSPMAAEGYALPLPLLDLIANDAAGLAASIAYLHGSEPAFAACRDAGLAYIAEAFSEAAVDAAMRDAAGLPPP